MISYGKKTTKAKFDRLKSEARDDLRKFSSNKLQRTCGVQPLNSVRVYKSNGRFRHDATIACKTTNSCPWCSPPKLAAHRTKINAMAIHAIDMGGFILKGTLTLPKRNSEDLGYSYSVLMSQIARFRRKVRQIEQEYNITASVRTLEETYSEVTFWHPHVNWIWFIHEQMSLEALVSLEQRLLDAWLSAAELGNIRGVQIAAQRFNSFYTDAQVKKQAEYVTNHSFFPDKMPTKSPDGLYHKLKPWDILQLARTGETKWISVFRQFEKGVKSKQKVVYYMKN